MFLETFCFLITPVFAIFISTEFNFGRKVKASFLFFLLRIVFIFFKASLNFLFLDLFTAVCFEILLIRLIADLIKDGSTHWDGVRNYQARNFMRDKMRIGDMVLYYHSNTKPPHIAGISKICKESYPDITQFDKKSKYYDPKATEEVPRWFLVDMEPVTKFNEIISLNQLNDKKNTGDRISLILLKKIGKTSNPGQVKITIGEMKKILKNIN